MNEPDPIIQYLSRPENLSIALDVEGALKAWDSKSPESTSESITSVLSNQENLVIARSIFQRTRRVKRTLLLSFGADLHRMLNELLQEENIERQWELRFQYHQEWTKPYAGSGLLPFRSEDAGESPYLYIIIQRTGNFVNFGISRSEPKGERPEYWQLSEVKVLESWLLGEEYYRHLWWLGYKHQFDLREDDIYLGMAGRRDELVKDTVEIFWDLFTRTRPMMEQANQAITQRYLQSDTKRNS